MENVWFLHAATAPEEALNDIYPKKERNPIQKGVAADVIASDIHVESLDSNIIRCPHCPVPEPNDLFLLLKHPFPTLCVCLQKHDDAVKRVAGPSRTGKARTKAARALKRKLKEMAADGTITAADFEMAEADADAELAAAASAKDVKVKAAGIKVGKKKVIKAAPAPKAVRASTRQSARLAAADSGVAAMDE